MAKHKSDAHYLAAQMKGLKGAKVLDIGAFEQEDLGYCDIKEYWVGILLQAKNGDVVQLTLSQDPEGNGPGFAFIDVVEEARK